jgi:hypothetical protein
MKKIIFLLFLNLVLGGCSLLDRSPEYKQRTIAIQNLVAEIQSALVLVNEEVKQKTNLTLNNALLTINTEIGESQDGGADLWVLSGQASSENRSSDKVIIKLVPDPNGPAELTFKSTEEMLSERLAKSIIAAVEGVSKVGAGKYPMKLSNLTIEMGIITRTVGAGSAGLVFEVLPISIGAGGALSKANLNVLRLEFSQNEQM